jgi:hypothetical protein
VNGFDDNRVAAEPVELVSLADTADLHAVATALIERSAAACVSGVPEDTAGDGRFVPVGVAWQVSTDLASPGMRAAGPL